MLISPFWLVSKAQNCSLILSCSIFMFHGSRGDSSKQQDERAVLRNRKRGKKEVAMLLTSASRCGHACVVGAGTNSPEFAKL